MNIVLVITIVLTVAILYLMGFIFSIAFLFRLLANITEKSWQGILVRALISPILLAMALVWPASVPVLGIVALIVWIGNTILDAVFDFAFFGGIELADTITGD